MYPMLMSFVLPVATVPERVTIPPVPVAGKIAWLYDEQEARERARQQNKPLFIVFRCER